MQDTAAIFWRVVPAFLLAVAGGTVSAMAGLSHERLCALISLAAGTLLGVTLFSILPESWDVMNWWELALAFGSGYAVFWFISKFVYHVCPCAASHFDEATTHRFGEIASALVIALAIHSTMDGVALAAGNTKLMATNIIRGDERRPGSGHCCWRYACTRCRKGWPWGPCSLGAGITCGRVVTWVAAV